MQDCLSIVCQDILHFQFQLHAMPACRRSLSLSFLESKPVATTQQPLLLQAIKKKILSQVVSLQTDLLVQYGGVAPKMAQEAHAHVIDHVVEKALHEAKIKASHLSAVAVTIGPVGVRKARQVAKNNRLPIVNVHHMEAHALTARLTDNNLQFPFLALLVSGGHSLLVLARSVGEYLRLGTTLDDAIGEAYDKTARCLGLNIKGGGGQALEVLAREGNPNSFKFSVPMQQHKDCNFSFAGLKTQVHLAVESSCMYSSGYLVVIFSRTPRLRALGLENYRGVVITCFLSYFSSHSKWDRKYTMLEE